MHAARAGSGPHADAGVGVPAAADRHAPELTLALKFTKSGTYAFRRTILNPTRTDVAAGKTTFTQSLTRRVRASLRKGETVTLTVQARDAAGNSTTRRATAKVL